MGRGESRGSGVWVRFCLVGGVGEEQGQSALDDNLIPIPWKPSQDFSWMKTLRQYR